MSYSLYVIFQHYQKIEQENVHFSLMRKATIRHFDNGYVDQTLTEVQVCNLFIKKYPNRPITRSTVSNVKVKFRNFANIADNYKKD